MTILTYPAGGVSQQLPITGNTINNKTPKINKKSEKFIMPQLRVGHWIYRIEGQYIEKALFLRQNVGLLSAAQLSAKMVRCGKFLKNRTDSYPHRVFFGAFRI